MREEYINKYSRRSRCLFPLLWFLIVILRQRRRTCFCRCLFFCLSSRRDLLLPLPLPVLLHSTKNPGCPILSPPDRATVGERTPLPRHAPCFCRCHCFSSSKPKPIHSQRKRRASALRINARRRRYRSAEGRSEGAAGTTELSSLLCLCFRPFPHLPNYFSRIYSAKSHVKPPNPPKNQ